MSRLKHSVRRLGKLHAKKLALLGVLLGSVSSYSAYSALSATDHPLYVSGDQLYRFSGRKQLEEQAQNQQQAGQTPPQVQLWEQEQTDTGKSGQPNQQAGSAGTSILNNKGGPPGSDQLPEGTRTPLPGGGPKMGVGPVGPGGTSETTAVPDEGPNRYASRPPSWENLTETDAGRNRNEPGAGNTSSATGANIFGTTPAPFVLGAGNRY